MVIAIILSVLIVACIVYAIVRKKDTSAVGNEEKAQKSKSLRFVNDIIQKLENDEEYENASSDFQSGNKADKPEDPGKTRLGDWINNSQKNQDSAVPPAPRKRVVISTLRFGTMKSNTKTYYLDNDDAVTDDIDDKHITVGREDEHDNNPLKYTLDLPLDNTQSMQVNRDALWIFFDGDTLKAGASNTTPVYIVTENQPPVYLNAEVNGMTIDNNVKICIGDANRPLTIITAKHE